MLTTVIETYYESANDDCHDPRDAVKLSVWHRMSQKLQQSLINIADDRTSCKTIFINFHTD